MLWAPLARPIGPLRYQFGWKAAVLKNVLQEFLLHRLTLLTRVCKPPHSCTDAQDCCPFGGFGQVAAEMHIRWMIKHGLISCWSCEGWPTPNGLRDAKVQSQSNKNIAGSSLIFSGYLSCILLYRYHDPDAHRRCMESHWHHTIVGVALHKDQKQTKFETPFKPSLS